MRRASELRSIAALGKAVEKAKAKRPTERVVVEPIITAVNEFAQQHGDYEQVSLSRQSQVLANRGGTPIARWIKAGFINEVQERAIDYTLALWDRAWGSQSLVMDLNRVKGPPALSGWTQQEAIDELKWFEGRIPRAYWTVYEAVCRDDEPAGVAGSKLGTSRNDATVAARTCVCFVADLIASWKRF